MSAALAWPWEVKVIRVPRFIERWVQRQVEDIPATVRREMLDQHESLIDAPGGTSPYSIANSNLAQQRAKLIAGGIQHAYDESYIRDCAENWARAAAVIPMLTQREEFARWHGIQPPPRAHLTDRYEACAARLADPMWWRRQLRKAWTRASENAVRELGVIRRDKIPYASDDAVEFRRKMKYNLRKFQEGAVLTNEELEQLPLSEVADASISNPALRRGEFMTRVRGFEELANIRRDVPLFFTLTTPSLFHPQRATGGKNPAFYVEETPEKKRETVRTAQRWLCRMWARARAALHRQDILIYGFRIAEPHHDGRPHWHALFFVDPKCADTVSAVISDVWLKDSGDEPGARAHRVRVEKIDPARGSATGYLAKYIAKNIDGHGSIGLDHDDETDAPVSESVIRVDAWSAIHGIRQFQQIGGPPVGIWREVRRLRDEEVEDDLINKVREKADRGDWCGFCRSVTWDWQGTRHTSVKLWKEETGSKSRYGDCRPARILGLQCTSVRVETRPHEWKIGKKGQACSTAETTGQDRNSDPAGSDSSSESGSSSDLGPVAITVRCIPGTGSLIQGRRAMMTAPGQPDVPPVVCVDEQSRYRSNIPWREGMG